MITCPLCGEQAKLSYSFWASGRHAVKSSWVEYKGRQWLFIQCGATQKAIWWLPATGETITPDELIARRGKRVKAVA